MLPTNKIAFRRLATSKSDHIRWSFILIVKINLKNAKLYSGVAKIVKILCTYTYWPSCFWDILDCTCWLSRKIQSSKFQVAVVVWPMTAHCLARGAACLFLLSHRWSFAGLIHSLGGTPLDTSQLLVSIGSSSYRTPMLPKKEDYTITSLLESFWFQHPPMLHAA